MASGGPDVLCNRPTPPHPAPPALHYRFIWPPLDAPSDPTPARMSCLGLAEDPIGLCKLQRRGGRRPRKPRTEAPQPSATLPIYQPPTTWRRLQLRATGGPGEPFPAPDPVSGACWGPHRAMHTPGAGRRRPRKPLCCLPSSLPTAHRLPRLQLVTSHWGGSKVLSCPGLGFSSSHFHRGLYVEPYLGSKAKRTVGFHLSCFVLGGGDTIAC